MLTSLTAFCEPVGSRLADATFEEQQVLLDNSDGNHALAVLVNSWLGQTPHIRGLYW